LGFFGCFFVKVREGGDPQKALNMGEFVAAALMLGSSYLVITNVLPAEWTLSGGKVISSRGVFWALAVLISVAGADFRVPVWRVHASGSCCRRFR